MPDPGNAGHLTNETECSGRKLSLMNIGHRLLVSTEMIFVFIATHFDCVDRNSCDD
jgi:hypothetical protein